MGERELRWRKFEMGSRRGMGEGGLKWVERGMKYVRWVGWRGEMGGWR